LVEDGTLDELAKVLPLDSAFVDVQFAAECRLKGFEPKQDGNFTGSGETGAGGAVKCPPFVGADGARDFRGEERSTARRRWSYGGPSVQAHLLFRCETERRVAVGTDVGEFRADGAVVNDGANESHRSLVVGRG
jgi:hypothetical protein